MERKIAIATFWVNGSRMGLALARYDDGRLALTGEHEGSIGQCDDAIREDAGHVPDVAEVLDIWSTYHLKKAPESAFELASLAIFRLDGQHIGEAPDIFDAPDIDGEIFDSRDAVKRLEIYRQATLALGIPEEVIDTFTNEQWPEGMPEELEDNGTIEEFLRLRILDAEGSAAASDWAFGETAIREDHFEDYCEQYLADVGILPDDLPGFIAIDWAKTAAAMQMDYTEIHYGDETYLIR